MTREATLGLRNRNPGNLRASAVGQKWLGEVAANKGFAVFDTMQHGIRAATKQLLVYQEGRRQLRTIAEMISTWAPPTENRTQSYIDYVSKSCELDPDTPVSLRDWSTAYWMVRAICEMENGRQTFNEHVDEQTLQEGIQEALA